MEKIKVNPIIKDESKWTVEKNEDYSLNQIKDLYLNSFVTDGVDDLHVTQIKITPTGITSGHYVIDLIDDETNASQFLKL
jgi:hypothetical protein